MPEVISVYLIAVWFAVGVFTGAGWAVGQRIVAKVFG
jgi:hypothetical protein